MFNLVDIGERAGSGFPQIVRTCSEFGYNQPIIQDTFKPDRITLTVFSVKKDYTKPDTKQQKSDTKYSAKK